jgi:hypothetical protein
VVVLLTCLICPLLELFDSWDDTIQSGNDTEYALVILALCVGVAYSFARFISKSRAVWYCCEEHLRFQHAKILSFDAMRFLLVAF